MFDFSKRLLKLRKSRGLSQIELAQKVQISSSTLGNYENDMGIPSLSVAESLADVLNVSLDYLACGEKANVISVKGLKEEQIELVTELIQELARPANHNPKSTRQQQELLARIIEQFVH